MAAALQRPALVRDQQASPGRQRPKVSTDIPARLDRLPWSRFHVLIVFALGIYLDPRRHRGHDHRRDCACFARPADVGAVCGPGRRCRVGLYRGRGDGRGAVRLAGRPFRPTARVLPDPHRLPGRCVVDRDLVELSQLCRFTRRYRAFYAVGNAVGGITAPLLFGFLLATRSPLQLASGYVIAAVLMLGAACVEAIWGIDAEGRSLEEIADPLSSE